MTVSENDRLRACNEHILKTIELAKAMLELADLGDASREDTGCGILYGILRDSAYKLQQLAEKERQTHIRKGIWYEED
jgi:hypothetical protein